MKGQFEGKVALVTGGASGIGRATALAFSKEGASVVISDVLVDGGEETVRMIRKAKGEAIFVKADVSKAVDVEALIRKAVENYGRLDYAHNNAGISGDAGVPTADCTEESWDRVISINLKGVWLCMKYEIPQMLKQGGGAIVNTASCWGLVGAEGAPAYSASKGGVIQLTRVAALEYARAGIRVNAVCPSPVQTPLFEGTFASLTKERAMEVRAWFISNIPLGRIGNPEEVAGAVIWLCSDAASFVTGHPMSVDGGWVAH